MTLKTAAFLALLGTILAAALLMWDLVFDISNVIQGMIPAVKLFSAIIYAFASLAVAIFFYVFQKAQR